jgi:hypothetical protein
VGEIVCVVLHRLHSMQNQCSSPQRRPSYSTVGKIDVSDGDVFKFGACRASLRVTLGVRVWHPCEVPYM